MTEKTEARKIKCHLKHFYFEGGKICKIFEKFIQKRLCNVVVNLNTIIWFFIIDQILVFVT